MKEKTQSGRSGGGRSVAAAAPGRTSGGDDTGRAGGSGVQGFGRSLPAASGPGEDVRGGGLRLLASAVRAAGEMLAARRAGIESKRLEGSFPPRRQRSGSLPLGEREESLKSL